VSEQSAHQVVIVHRRRPGEHQREVGLGAGAAGAERDTSGRRALRAGGRQEAPSAEFVGEGAHARDWLTDGQHFEHSVAPISFRQGALDREKGGAACPPVSTRGCSS
jgi:hypothetical protein